MSLARDIVLEVELHSGPLMPVDLMRKFKLNREEADDILSLAPHAFGPGGRGEAWMLKEVAHILNARFYDSAERHIDSGFYYVTDREAGALARDARRALPARGTELRVELPDGRSAWLTRTDVSARYKARGERRYKRGWVWSVYGLSR